MYKTFYQLREKPFSLKPDPSFFYLGKDHRQGIDILEYALSEKAGFVLVTGEVGSGKSTLIQYMVRFLDADANIAIISNTHPAMGSIARRILAAFGLDYSSTDPVDVHEKLNKFFAAEVAQERRIVLVIDEAQNLEIGALEELRLISNIDLGDVSCLQIILCGQPEILMKFSCAELRQLSQRISSTVYLRCLPLSETRDYIRHRLRVAGGCPDIFSNEACAAVYACSDGLPRLINQVSEITLVFGYGRGLKVLNAETVLDACEEMRVGDFACLADDAVSQKRIRTRLLEEVGLSVKRLEQVEPESQQAHWYGLEAVNINEDSLGQSDAELADAKANVGSRNPLIRPIYENGQCNKEHKGQSEKTVRRQIGIVIAMVLLLLIGFSFYVFDPSECSESPYRTCWRLETLLEILNASHFKTVHQLAPTPQDNAAEAVGALTAFPEQSAGSVSPSSGNYGLTTPGLKSISSTVAEIDKQPEKSDLANETGAEAGQEEQTVEYPAAFAQKSVSILPQLEKLEQTSASHTVSHAFLASLNGDVDSQHFGGVVNRLADNHELVAALDNKEYLEQELIVLLQYALKRRHYEPGPIDGKLGYRTTAAIQSFQRDAGLMPDGHATQTLLKRLRDQSKVDAALYGVQPLDGIDSPADSMDSLATSSVDGALAKFPQSVRLASTADTSMPDKKHNNLSAQPPAGPPTSLVRRNIWPDGGDLSSDLGDEQRRDPELILLIQYALQKLGYKPGQLNGEQGTRTANSIRAFQRDFALAVDGQPSPELLQRLHSHLGIHSSRGSDPPPSNPPPSNLESLY